MLALANDAFNVEPLPVVPAAEVGVEVACVPEAAAGDGVPPLQTLCADILTRVIDVENAVGLLQLANNLDMPELSAACSDFICAHLSTVLATEDFAALPADLQQALLMCAVRVENPAGSASTAYHSPQEFLAIVGEYYDEISARLREASEELRERRRRRVCSLGDDDGARGGNSAMQLLPSSDVALLYAEHKIAQQQVRVEAVRRYRDNQRALFAALRKQQERGVQAGASG